MSKPIEVSKNSQGDVTLSVADSHGNRTSLHILKENWTQIVQITRDFPSLSISCHDFGVYLRCEQIAADMLAPNDSRGANGLHGDLRQHLRRINELCRLAGGVLRSRQAVALAVQQWMDSNRDQEPYDPS